MLPQWPQDGSLTRSKPIPGTKGQAGTGWAKEGR